MSAEAASRSPAGAPLETEIEQLRRQLAAAEQRMRSGADRYRMILESALDYAVIALDLDGLVTEWNDGAGRILGWTEAEMLGRSSMLPWVPQSGRPR